MPQEREPWYERTGELWEVFDADSQRTYGRVWTTKFHRHDIWRWECMPPSMMLRRVEP